MLYRQDYETPCADHGKAIQRAYQMDDWAKELPGADLIYPGIAELARGEGSAEASLVAIGSPRLRRLGFRLPENAKLPAHPDLLMYRPLCERYGKAAHSQYNALIRRLVSFERAAEFSTRALGPRRAR